ncbi:VWA domain-containing protein, partial [Oscillatoriales cyanobacterium LEGE 11467]
MSIAKSTQPTSIGGLYADSPRRQMLFPLQHMAVVARIAGNLSRVRVRQTFANRSDRSLEATYIFPLPCGAAVDRLQVRIGERTISGRIEKRETAYKIYQQAKQEGRTAGLLEQERDNIFAQSIAHIRPGEQIEIDLLYTELLRSEGAECEFVFPTVVGPRYIPGRSISSGTLDTELVPDASRICPPIKPFDIPSLNRLDIKIEIDAGLPIDDVRSPSHDIDIERHGHLVRVHLTAGDTIPNRDAIVRYRVAGTETRSSVLTQADERGGHFALYSIPASIYSREDIFPKDVVFLIDTSGSQMGDPLEKSQELMCRFIRGLNPEDTFTIINFADTAKQLSLAPLTNTPMHCERAIDYIQNLHAYGGTRMLGGIRAAIEFPEPQPGRLRSVVMLSDGYIGNECAILAEVQDKLQPGNRLHTFGVGSSVNRFLIEGLARVGRGISRVVRPDEPTAEVAETFFRQINNPVLRDIEVCWHGEGESPQIYPEIVPDLFDRQPLTIFGRKTDRRPGTLQITGTTPSGERYERQFGIGFETGGNEAIAQLWGRSRIEHL